MSYEVRDQSGTMFRNKRKERDSHPDWSGDGMVNGQLVWLNAWEKKDKNGNLFYSFSFKNKQAKEEPRQQGANIGPDDDIPFAPSF